MLSLGLSFRLGKVCFVFDYFFAMLLQRVRLLMLDGEEEVLKCIHQLHCFAAASHREEEEDSLNDFL